MLLLNYQNTTFSVLLIGVIIIILAVSAVYILPMLSNRYVKKNLENYKNSLTIKCNKTAQNLLSRFPEFNQNNTVIGFNKTFDCSSSIVSGAFKEPIKYLIKYTNIEYDENSLTQISNNLRFVKDFDALKNDLEGVKQQTVQQLPLVYRIFINKEQLPYTICNISHNLQKIENPVFIFSYVSPQGRACRRGRIEITEIVLERIEKELQENLRKKFFSSKQRSLMTNDLRNAIKKRDNYTCKNCGNSVYEEPNLLLEVDHIIPVSKGGKTEANNLQTLCWKCNRMKSDNV